MTASLLSVRNVSKSFGGLKAVDQVTLDVAPGEVLAVIGPNGAGKSTLMKLISGFERPDTGEVTVGETNVAGLPPYQIALNGVIRTFQDNVVFPDDTPLEALIVAQQGARRSGALGQFFGTRTARDEMAKMAATAQDILAEMELDTLSHMPCSALSHGHLRRLSIAMALAAGPRILLLDEPFAGLNDTETTAAMRHVRNIADQRDIGVVLVEHDMRAVMEISDRIFVLNQGKPIAQGVPETIRTDPIVIEAYLGSYGTAGDLLA